MHSLRKFACSDRPLVCLAVLLLVGGALRGAALMKPIDTGDIDRFEALAESMLRGEGYSLRPTEAARFLAKPEQTLVTELPPGYPVLIAAYYKVWHDRRILLVTNWSASMAAIVVVYLAVRRRSPRGALFAAGLLAFNPWICRWAGIYQSESTGLLLMSVLALCISRIDAGVARWWDALALGALTSAVPLTIPGGIFLCAGAFLAALWLMRRRPAAIVATLAGAVLVMAPWQAHCVKATGRIQPLILTQLDRITDANAMRGWVNTWMWSSNDYHIFFAAGAGPEEFDAYLDHLDPSVFADESEREALKASIRKPIDERTADFRAAARRNRARISALRYHVELPLCRAATLWTEHQRLQWRFTGRNDAIVEFGFSLWNWTYLAIFVFLALRAVASRNPLAWAVVAGVVLYTLACGYNGMTEYRRNYPFYAPLLCLIGLAGKKSSPAAALPPDAAGAAGPARSPAGT